MDDWFQVLRIFVSLTFPNFCRLITFYLKAAQRPRASVEGWPLAIVNANLAVVSPRFLMLMKINFIMSREPFWCRLQGLARSESRVTSDYMEYLDFIDLPSASTSDNASKVRDRLLHLSIAFQGSLDSQQLCALDSFMKIPGSSAILMRHWHRQKISVWLFVFLSPSLLHFYHIPFK